MQNVSELFKTEIRKPLRQFRAKATIKTANLQTYELDDEDIVLGSMRVSSACQRDQLEFGAVIASDFSIRLINSDGRWDDIDLIGATIEPYSGIVLPNSTTEYVLLGTFIVDRPGRPYSTVDLRAADRLVLLDRPLSEVAVTYPTTNYGLLSAICQHCNVPLSPSMATSLIERNRTIPAAPEQDMSCRDAVSEIALMGRGFAQMTRDGELKIVQMPVIKPGAVFNEYELGPGDRGGYVKTTDQITLTGIKYLAESDPISVGTDEYVLEIDEMGLVQSDTEGLIQGLFAAANGLTYHGYETDYSGNPAIDPGDVVKIVKKDGIHTISFVGQHDFVHGGTSGLAARGKSATELAYRGGNARRLAALVAGLSQNRRDLTRYEQASANMSDMLGLMMGVYPSKEVLEDGSEILYWHNKPARSKSDIIWKFNGAVLAVSNDGGQTWTGQTSDGTVIATIVYALQINASQILLSDGTTNVEQAIDEIELTPGPPGESAYELDIESTNGNIFKNGIIETWLHAKVYQGGTDITDTIDANRFRWTRKSTDTAGDEEWNQVHFSGQKSVQVTTDDVNKRATFFCVILEN